MELNTYTRQHWPQDHSCIKRAIVECCGGVIPDKLHDHLTVSTSAGRSQLWCAIVSA